MASDDMPLISFFVATILMGFVYPSSHASEFSVGGKYGWALRPSKSTYNQWAARTRFQVNDSLVFKYKNGTDSVLVVDQDDYDTCNKAKPIRSLENEGGYSKIKFDHAGPFFFISGYAHNCEKGRQKIVILVMNPRGHGGDTPQVPSPASSPVPNSPAPAPIPTPTPTPSPAVISSEEAKSGVAAFGGAEGTLVNLLFCWVVLISV